jgi:hypothetical protein
MVEDLTELVRRSCREVVDAARLVSIDDERLAGLADELADAADAARRVAPAPADPEAAAALVLALDAVNFGSGWHDVVRKRPGLSGARTMAAALREHAAAVGGLTAEHLRAMTPDRCTAVFGQDPADPDVGLLMAAFASSLADLGALVAERFDGRFLGLVEAAAGSAVALASRLSTLASYRDRAIVDGRDVHFYKRAQISAADLHRELGGLEPACFHDLHRLTAFADNLVPHVLRVDGALRYDDALAARIDDRRLLDAGSRAEIEIRAAGVEAVERLTAAIGDRGRPVRPMDLDLALWTRGGQPRYKAVPRHRARSPFY